MSYVGNPIDTQNTFQSLVGKRFNGDGSTTAFTLDVAPSSTLDLEVFVGNVRQDPNSAYTVSGTTLTFTGAPPSGTNNIYVVHQAKSVGTITPGANSVGITELNVSDGSNGQVLTTDGSGTLSFATASSADPASADGDSLGTASAEWSDLYLADGGIVYFGNDQDVRLTHNADKGLILKHSATADDKPVILTLQTGETDMAANDVIGKIEFQAPDEGTGTDAVLVSGAIQAVAEGDHSSSSNATRLEFMTGASEAATTKLKITSDGRGLSQFTAKVWANYNGNGDAMRDSHNISSLTDNGTGDYTFNFSNDFTNTSYAVVTGVYNGTSHGDFQDVDFMVNSTGNVRIGIGYVSGTNSAMTAHNALGVQIAIFGDE